MTGRRVCQDFLHRRPNRPQPLRERRLLVSEEGDDLIHPELEVTFPGGLRICRYRRSGCTKSDHPKWDCARGLLFVAVTED